MVHMQFGRGNGGGLGCLILGALALVAAYYILSGFLFLLWWAAPALFVLALIIDWRAVVDTVKNMFEYVQRNPVSGLILAALAVIGTGIVDTGIPFLDRLGYWIAQGGFTMLAFYVLLRALGYKQLNQFKQNMQTGQQQPPEEEFTEYEELESHPTNPLPESEDDPGQSPPESDRPDSERPYDQLFR